MAKQKRNKFEIVYTKKSKQWEVRQQGHVLEEGRTFTNKPNTVRVGMALARANKPSQLFIKRKNGKIQDERTYGNDPRRTPG